jgi:glycosyltransferase involved in cell wall biosynthesis
MIPNVSITICCYNGEKYIDSTLQSVFSQTYKNWEIVLINDGSTDSTEKIIQEYIRQGFPITYYYQPNTGLGAARNKSVELARGQFIAILDQDDIWYPTKLEKQVPLIENCVEIGFIYSDSDIIDENDNVISYGTMIDDSYEGNVFIPMLKHAFFPSWPTVLIRKELIHNVGGFRNYSSAEDFDLLLKISFDSSVLAVKKSLAAYRIHKNQLSSDRYKFLSEFLSIYDYWENHPEFLAHDKSQIISESRLKQYNLSAISAFEVMDDKIELRLYLFQLFKVTISAKIILLWILTWFKLTWMQKFLQLVKRVYLYFKSTLS